MLQFKKHIALALAVLLMVLSVSGVHAFAAAIDKNSSFEYRVSKAEGENAPGNILVELYVKTDPEALITTAGATLVINTDYVDVVNKKGAVITDKYLADVVAFGKDFPVTTAKIGDEQQSLSSIKGLSLASYNAKSKNLYLFMCGMAIEGITIAQKSLMASYYLQSKSDGKLPAGAIRLAKVSELGTDCPSKAVYVTQISSKKEVGTAPSAITLDADEALIESGSAAPETTAAQEDTTKQTSQAQSTSAAAQKQSTTKKVSEMTEAEVEEELKDKIAASKALTLSDEQKQSEAYKAYEEAVEEAEKVVNDKNATAAQKQQALEKLREAEAALEQAYPDLAKQLQTSEKSPVCVWLYVGIGAAVVAAGIIVVLIINKKKSKNP